jgi:hypothetical protein
MRVHPMGLEPIPLAYYQLYEGCIYGTGGRTRTYVPRIWSPGDYPIIFTPMLVYGFVVYYPTTKVIGY